MLVANAFTCAVTNEVINTKEEIVLGTFLFSTKVPQIDGDEKKDGNKDKAARFTDQRKQSLKYESNPLWGACPLFIVIIDCRWSNMLQLITAE